MTIKNPEGINILVDSSKIIFEKYPNFNKVKVIICHTSVWDVEVNPFYITKDYFEELMTNSIGLNEAEVIDICKDIYEK